MPLGKYWVELAISVAAAVVVRGSACTINDIFDREYDAGVGKSLSCVLDQGSNSHYSRRTYQRPASRKR